MSLPVLVGSSIPAGLEHLRLHSRLKQGDIVLTLLPRSRDEALAVARYCRENRIYLVFSELLHRGSHDLCWAWREKVPRDRFFSKEQMDEIIDAAGEYYFGRVTIGEIGGVLYWPKAYTIGRRAENWENLPPCETMAEAQAAYIAYVKKWLDYERSELGKGPLMNVDSSLVFKYHAMAGLDILCLEAMPGDPHLMHAAIRGAARAFGKPWGAHVAMQCYGGMCFDTLYRKRWRTSLYFSFIAGADFIYPESGHYTYANVARGQRFGFHSRQMKSIRRDLRELWQFARIHRRPAGGPKVALGVVHGNHDGTPGLWNRYAWGQYHHEKWLEGPPERGWRFVDKFHRKEDWPKETVQGDEDFSGNPPYGQYDVVPIEAPIETLRHYSCLVFLGWNTMTPEIYEKLKAYVAGGGHLLMFLPHLSTHTDRADDLRLFRDGDFTDLFGVRVTGRYEKDVRGVKCLADASIRSWRLPLWRINTDPRFMGNFTPAKVKVTTAKVLSGWSDFYHVTEAELRRKPMLVENRLGKGRAYLVTACEYPADEGLGRLTGDLIRVVLQGEQGDIRLLGPDRVRYAVYEDTPPPDRRKCRVVYLLNTDPDCNALVRLWVRGRRSGEFVLPANELRLAWIMDDVVLVPEERRVDLESWRRRGKGHAIALFCATRQNVEIHNLDPAGKAFVLVNGARRAVGPSRVARIPLTRRADRARREFFAPDFLEEPRVRYRHAGLPY